MAPDDTATELDAATALPEVVMATPDEFDALLESRPDVLLLLYLWGTNCPNCDFFATRLPLLRKQLAGAALVIVKVDAYTHPEFARRYGVFGIPHFLLFSGGKRLGKMSEFKGDAFWLAVIREHLPEPASTTSEAT
jgi:thioredoxin 1